MMPLLQRFGLGLPKILNRASQGYLKRINDSIASDSVDWQVQQTHWERTISDPWSGEKKL